MIADSFTKALPEPSLGFRNEMGLVDVNKELAEHRNGGAGREKLKASLPLRAPPRWGGVGKVRHVGAQGTGHIQH
jgi:hypothetical protein